MQATRVAPKKKATSVSCSYLLRAQLLRSRERVVLQNALATVQNLSFHPEVKVRLVEDGAISSLVGLLNSQDPEVQEHAAAALRNIMAES